MTPLLSFDYDLLNALAAVVREGSFETAAKSLGVTQSATSQRIKQLEKRTGTILIVRGRPCVPTPAAVRLIEHLEQVSLLQRELADELGEIIGLSGNEVTTLRISVNNDSLATWFPEVIKRSKDELGIRLDIIPDDQDYTEERLKTGEASAVVTTVEKPIPGCRRIALGAMDYIAVAAPDFYANHFIDGVTPETIRGTACLAWDRKDNLQDKWMATVMGESIDVTIYNVPSYDGYLECCVNGTAWGIVPRIAAKSKLESGEIIELQPERFLPVSLYWQTSAQAGKALQSFERILVDAAKNSLLSIGQIPIGSN